MNAYLRLMRFDKPIGIYLLLWPTLWALFLAEKGIPQIDLLIIFTLGVIVMRAAGCVINDYADRKIDKFVERTKNRPITSGELSAKSALWLFLVLILVAFQLVLMTNFLTIKIALLAVLLAIIYPFTKNYTHFPQFILGLAFAMSVPMAFAATNNYISSSAWWLFTAAVIWTVIYDTIYAIADREEDLQIGIKSTAVLFKKFDKLIIAILQILLLLVLIKIYIVFDLTIYYNIALILSGFLMIYHQYLIKDRKKEKCLKAFLNNNYIGMLIFIGITLSIS
jgi:4-hydroxybenzoate polyprenyltransferase